MSIFTTIAAVAGLIFGFGSLILGILNYRRDRHKVVVMLDWDSGYIGLQTNQKGRWGTIYVTNEGRRTVCITFVGLDIPGQRARQNLLTGEHYPLRKLLESEVLGSVDVSG